MTAQLNMLGALDETALVGLAITLPEQCPRCNAHDAVIGAGRGPHKASIMCVCGRHLGWMSTETFNFIHTAIQQCGRPTEPICVNRQRATAEVKLPTTAMK